MRSHLDIPEPPAPDESGWAKVWVNFDGTGTASIRDSHNVTSVTDHGTGQYTVVIGTNFANTNYACTAFARASTDVNNSHILVSALRSEERRVGKECVWPCRYRRLSYH